MKSQHTTPQRWNQINSSLAECLFSDLEMILSVKVYTDKRGVCVWVCVEGGRETEGLIVGENLIS
jgi:hypothetical protein